MLSKACKYAINSMIFLATVPEGQGRSGLKEISFVINSHEVLSVIQLLTDYPLEKATLTLVLLNPVDLGRILMLMQLDISALMGYTGAFFQQFFPAALVF